ncbi:MULTISPECIES: biotin--[acetyl-CoA-carboxylase] ligase [Tissierellales]|jgi:BirA family biotin operon repressor/biotin-[acetyl-CoA-carboxylase] ligase|uniref:Bifunctional ligase/repressor BirA n=1 Tax=Acidilutibacter cellobiosedens TaxID=2507161 RepID=A0A410QGL0_9FIRM|nr:MULTISPECIES: biotin--[acetyl-CoA-carboxylase] ligase [Tissierellales]MBE6082353.1 biotin--[acetyl-CoA-carboxylase] ligase [Tissierellaceae bacterium]QAT63076.1 biotin--[acetyl-CoA-carboxylase] ligase [Acidilutibacter cellobiosedens]SCL85845.1 Bifunctional protein BirA [Sporanaerobacter sp. PP17-6a]
MKDEILRLLKNNKDEFLSGEKIGEKLGVSRAAIWKYINVLKEEGYGIESVPKQGYRIVSVPDVLTYEEIKEYLSTKFVGRNICYFDTISSTNMEAKRIALKNPEGTVVISEEQAKGKGRLDRNWVSPPKKGIWMSMILKPETEPTKVAKITLLGAAGVNKALEDMGIYSKIKWPNDIVIDGKKVCGILTEMSCELNMINYVIMGIGINVNMDREDFSENLINKATSLKIEQNKEINRKELLAGILNRFEEFYIPFKEDNEISEVIEICKKNSALIGKKVRVIKDGETKTGKALDINNEGQLIVMFEDGSIENIFSGEVSVRGLEGYV